MGSAAIQALPLLPAGIPWVLAVVLALLDGRRRWVGVLAAAGLVTSLVSLVCLAFVVLQFAALGLDLTGAAVDDQHDRFAMSQIARRGEVVPP